MAMILRGTGVADSGRARRARLALAFAAALFALAPVAASAQMFSDRPPPVPPASVPDAPSGPALNLAPPSGPGAGPALPAPLTQPPPAQPFSDPPELVSVTNTRTYGNNFSTRKSEEYISCVFRTSRDTVLAKDLRLEVDPLRFAPGLVGAEIGDPELAIEALLLILGDTEQKWEERCDAEATLIRLLRDRLEAGILAGQHLRSLDALHLAAAVRLGVDVDAEDLRAREVLAPHPKARASQNADLDEHRAGKSAQAVNQRSSRCSAPAVACAGGRRLRLVDLVEDARVGAAGA
jgi:hypothetical protein